MRRIILALAASSLLAGCGASLKGGSINAAPETNKPVAGLPYRVRDQLAVEVYQLTDKGYVLVGSQTELMADPASLYVLNFTGRPLTDATLKIDQRTDGTLSIVNLSSTGKAAELMTNAATGIDAVQGAHKTISDARKAEKAAADAADDAAAAKLKAEATAMTEGQLAAVRTRDEVYRLQLKLGEDRAGLKPSEVQAAESAIRIAKMQANTAAIAAGQEVPFPTID